MIYSEPKPHKRLWEMEIIPNNFFLTKSNVGGDIENIVWLLKYMNFLDISVTLVAQMVKNLPAMLETWVLSLGQEDPLEKAWLPALVFWSGECHGQTSLAGYSSWGYKQSGTTEQLTHTHTQVLRNQCCLGKFRINVCSSLWFLLLVELLIQGTDLKKFTSV